MEKMTFNGQNFDKIKEFAGDACKIKPVYDNNGVVWGQRAYVKTKHFRVCLDPYDIVIKDERGIHVYKE